MAPIVSDPEKAFPHAESVRALRALASLAGTTAAVISGRALKDLAALSRLPAEVQLVGSHGSEFDIGFIHAIDADAKKLLGEITEELTRIATLHAGTSVEAKPASVALHVRNADAEEGALALAAVRADAGQRVGVQVTEGKSVIELAVVATDKGHALDLIRHQDGATAAVFVGDDVTDEKAFARLQGPDLGVKVGPGESLAEFRVSTHRRRGRGPRVPARGAPHLAVRGHAPPIERLTMLASPRTVALVTPDATLTWLCHPGTRLGVRVRASARRTGGRPLQRRPAPQRTAAEPAVHRQHHDRADTVGQPLRHRLPAARRPPGPHRPDPGDQRAGRRRRDVRTAARVRAGPGHPGGGLRGTAGARHQRADRAALPRRAVERHVRRQPADRACRRRPVRRRRRPGIAVRHRRTRTVGDSRGGASRAGRDRTGRTGRRASPCPRSSPT